MSTAHPALAAAVAVVALAAPAAAQLGVPPAPTPAPTPAPGAPPALPAPGAAVVAAAQEGGRQALVGTFRLTDGACAGAVRGSYFRMIQPGGDPAGGPFVQNADSPCTDKTYTPLAAGTDGGLVTGAYQPQPSPPFGPAGGGRADRLTRPQSFYGVDFATATNPVDPQTGARVSPPAVTHDGAGRLGGDLRAFAATWNNQHFNQGAPKPDGSTPGTTTAPSGTYTAATRAFALGWNSLIVGGPFNGFTGQWHFEGTFVPSSSAAAAATGSTAAGVPAAPGPAAGAAGAPAGAAGRAPAGGRHPSTGPAVPATLGPLALAAGLCLLALARRAGPVRRASG